jgi:hypothetical protein
MGVLSWECRVEAPGERPGRLPGRISFWNIRSRMGTFIAGVECQGSIHALATWSARWFAGKTTLRSAAKEIAGDPLRLLRGVRNDRTLGTGLTRVNAFRPARRITPRAV